MKYLVSIPSDDPPLTYGPYDLFSAKDFARIGSQFGRDRIVTRKNGFLIRVYSEGKRSFPVAGDDMSRFRPKEIPRSL